MALVPPGCSAEWKAVRTVPDRSGGEIKIPGRPWHFADQVVTDEFQLPARQGEHNARVLAELGLTPAEIAALKDSGALIQHEQPTAAVSAGRSNLPGKESR
jgi:crotonobetainyl-CoA:carnitine CoA-transferase CaiB-like acyl-CoA transferase